MIEFVRKLLIPILVLTICGARAQQTSGDWQGTNCEGDTSVVDIRVTHTSCGRDNGAIAINVAGETSLQIRVDDYPFEDSRVFTDLYAKTYKVIVKKGNGCTASRTLEVKKHFPPTFVTVTTDNLCSSETGAIYASALGGYGTITYALDDQPFQQFGSFYGLASGEYKLRAKDSVGCETSLMVKIAPQNGAIVLEDVKVDHAKCGGVAGSISVIASGPGPFEYSIDGRNYVDSPGFSNVSPGRYELIVRDRGGCSTTETVVVNNAVEPVIHSVTEYNASCKGNDGAVSIRATGAGLLFSIDGVNFGTDTLFPGLTARSQRIYIIDSLGCKVSRPVTILQTCFDKLYIPTAFSPDHDGRNETMDIKFPAAELRVRYFRVYNRWGTVINFTDKTLQSGDALWDGMYKGNPAQPGSYPYEMMVEFADGRTEVIRNTIMLLR